VTAVKHRIELLCSASIFARTDDAIPHELANYCIVVVDRTKGRDRRYIETIGFYDPQTQPITLEVNEDRALYWLNQGAQPSDPVSRILNRVGTTSRLERLRKGEKLEALIAEAKASSAPHDYLSLISEVQTPSL
jgi:small subunit ribosomal protein S16